MAPSPAWSQVSFRRLVKVLELYVLGPIPREVNRTMATTRGGISALDLTYLRDIEAGDIVKATFDQWRHLDKAQYVSEYGHYKAAGYHRRDSLTLRPMSRAWVLFIITVKSYKPSSNRLLAKRLAIWLSPNAAAKTTSVIGASE